MNIPKLESPALDLLPYTPEQLLALIETPDRFETLAGFPAAEGLRSFLVSDEVSPQFVTSLRSGSGPDVWKYGFAVVHRDSRSVIGNGGFKGPPDASGTVEIAYGIVPAFEGRGYATEVARALVHFALQAEKVRVVRAHTLPTLNASTLVLSKCGFNFVSEVNDPDDGLVWRWELLRA